MLRNTSSTPCKGKNCAAKDGQEHSVECVAEYEAATKGMEKDIEKGPSPQEEKRLAFVGALYAKAETSHLKRIDALLILQATLAEMLVPAIEGLKLERDAIEPGSIPRHNADLMIEIAQELRAEALQMVDHAMANTRLILVPR